MPAMSESRPILILTASAGAGHVMAARALESAMHRVAPDQPVEVHDVLVWTGWLFRRLYGGGYLDLVRHAPLVMGWLYETMDRAEAGWNDRARRMAQNLFTPRIVRQLLLRRPRLILHTHFLAPEVVAHLRRRGRLACPQATVITDFETHRLWVQEPTERYYAATELGATCLRGWDVPAERIRVTGIPLRPGFAEALTRAEAQRRIGVATALPVVLLLAGAVGAASALAFLRQLLAVRSPLHTVVIAGRNERLRRAMEELARSTGRAATIVGFTDRVHEYMHAADLGISKPGGLTVSEALACGLPLVLVDPIPGQETRNADYLLERGAAIKVNHPRVLAARVDELLREPDRLARLRAAARTLGRPLAAEEIARDALELLEGAAARRV